MTRGLLGLLLILLFLAGCVGYVLNIFDLIGLAQAGAPITLMAALRALGLFFLPLGGVLGYF